VRVEALADGLDGLVCCAGIYRSGALVETDEAEMERSFDINVMGAFRIVRAFFSLLAKRGGRVVLIGTELSRCPMPFSGPYTVSKCALQAFADALRRELMFLGLRVSVVQPGAIRTPLLSGARSMVESGKVRALFPAQMEVVGRMLSREWEKGMEPVDVARVVVRALRESRPRAVYRVGNDPFRAMLAILPAGWADWLIRTFLGRRVRG
jgi:NAD(P)-dependent dehydrogenase (short-subunit alcohol dehydrogenase family)